jgi:hypothetical protein
MSKDARELLQWVAEQMPALKARVADTQALVERGRENQERENPVTDEVPQVRRA